MASDNPIFAEIARIENQADAALAEAKAKTAQIARDTREKVAALGQETDKAIEAAAARLAEEYKAKTDQALAQIETQFLKDEEALEAVRGARLEEMVEWTASQIRNRQSNAKPHGD